MSLSVSPAVAASLEAGQPVVALESTIISHGLPRPDNLAAACLSEWVKESPVAECMALGARAAAHAAGHMGARPIL